VGRDGLFPGWVAYMHPTRYTPIGAITALCVFGLVSGLILGILFTPIGAFAFLGTLSALFVLLIYMLVNIACFRYFWRKRRERFNLLRHGVFPLLSTLLIAAIFLASFIEPGAAPLSFTPYIVVLWMMLGVGVLFAVRDKLTAMPV